MPISGYYYVIQEYGKLSKKLNGNEIVKVKN